MELLSSSTYANSLLLLVSVVIIKFIIVNIKKDNNSTNFFSLYCQRFATKVNKPQNSSSQQKLSGWLALILSISTIVTFLWIFEIFIEVVWLWQALLLYFSVGNFNSYRLSNSLIKQLHDNDKTKAKKSLQPLVLRECESLSTLGLTKAFIEMQLLKANQLWLAPCLLFLLISPLAAITFRLVLAMHYQWNIKEKKFKYFGSAAALILNAIQWIPSKLLGLTLIITNINNHFLLHWRLVLIDLMTLNNDFLLHIFALANDIQLSGVAIYQGKKIRKKTFNPQGRQPEIKDIKTANKKLTVAIVFLVIIFCLPVLVNLSSS